MSVSQDAERVGDLTREEQEDAERQRQIELNQPLIALLESWAHATPEEIEEQRETWEFLKQALDEDRLSDRKLFP